jgi:hypothetical protein
MAAGARAVGVLGAPVVATVDDRGAVVVGAVALDWLVGAEDRWHDPRTDAAVRQTRLAPAPAYETRVRVPSGDAVQRVYGAHGSDGVPYVVVEVENASPVPFAVAFVLRVPRVRRRSLALSLGDDVVRAGDDAVLVLPKPPGRWAGRAAPAERPVHDVVVGGDAREGAFETVRGSAPQAGFVFPVAHRTVVRVALPLDPRAEPEAPVAALADAASVQRGWVTQLDRAMRAELPGRTGERLDAARATLLVEGGASAPASAMLANLEDWGFDAEAAAAWQRASSSARRAARRRELPMTGTRPPAADAPDGDFVRWARDALVVDHGDTIDLLPGFLPEWVGESVTVHDAPTRAGLVSFAVRWHGARPALLWDAPAGARLRAPALDPQWSSAAPAGDALLRAWPREPAVNGGAFS